MAHLNTIESLYTADEAGCSCRNMNSETKGEDKRLKLLNHHKQIIDNKLALFTLPLSHPSQPDTSVSMMMSTSCLHAAQTFKSFMCLSSRCQCPDMLIDHSSLVNLLHTLCIYTLIALYTQRTSSCFPLTVPTRLHLRRRGEDEEKQVG